MINKIAVIIMVCFISPVLFSCSTDANIKTSIKTFKNNRIAVSDALFMHEVFGITDSVKKFDKNLFIGSIQFSGGFIRNPEMGMMVQSKQKTLSDEQRFEKNAVNFVSELMNTILSERKIEVLHAASGNLVNLIVFSDEIDRVQYPEDQRDNICLPRLKRKPESVDKKTAAILYNEFKTRYLAVPVIEYYYGHNGGWFNGQNIGTAAGSRISFKLFIVDLLESAIVLNYEKVEVNLFEFDFSLSIIEMEQELYKGERKIISELRRVFP